MRTKRKKERFETILEPLQAILQIGYLSFAPIGTKLTIHNNILKIQIPNYSQPVIRWYNNDTQEDLFYLFNIFYRFKKFYHFLNDSKTNPENKKLYDLLIELAKTGIGNLIRTYSQTDKIHILHTLQMYKGMLEGEEKGTKNNEILSQKRFDSYELSNLSSNLHNSHASVASIASIASIASQRGGGMSRHDRDKNKKTHGMQKILRDDSPGHEEEREQEIRNTVISSNDSTLDASSPEVKNIDDVFIRITDIYTQEVYNIIYNTLHIMIKNEGSFDIYIDGLNKILEPTNSRIKKWIDEHIVF
jgi:F0F1-type ATP synthase delta subunit